MNPDTLTDGAPRLWADAVRYHTARLTHAGHDDPLTAAVDLVDASMLERAYQDDFMHGPTHYRHPDGPDAGNLACGMISDFTGAKSATTDTRHVRHPGCLAVTDKLIFTGAIPAGPHELAAASDRVGERYLREITRVPDRALPAATAGTVLHPLSVHVRTLATRVVRLTLRLGVALETAQGQAERARAAITDEGGLPSWTTLEPAPMLETAASAEALRMLSRVLDETAAVLVATVTRQNGDPA